MSVGSIIGKIADCGETVPGLNHPVLHKDAPGAFDLVADCDSSFIKGWVNT